MFSCALQETQRADGWRGTKRSTSDGDESGGWGQGCVPWVTKSWSQCPAAVTLLYASGQGSLLHAQLSPNSALGGPDPCRLLPHLSGSLVRFLFDLSPSCPRAQRTSAPVPVSAKVPAKRGQMERPKKKKESHKILGLIARNRKKICSPGQSGWHGGCRWRREGKGGIRPNFVLTSVRGTDNLALINHLL